MRHPGAAPQPFSTIDTRFDTGIDRASNIFRACVSSFPEEAPPQLFTPKTPAASREKAKKIRRKGGTTTRRTLLLFLGTMLLIVLPIVTNDQVYTAGGGIPTTPGSDPVASHE